MSDQPVIDIDPAPGAAPKEPAKEPNKLELALTKSGLDNESALQIRTGFASFLAQAEEWKVKVAGVTDAKVAGDSRRELKKIRVAAEKKRVELRKKVAVVGDTIQEAYALIAGITEPLETQLEEIEKKAERAEAARKEALKAERLAALAPYGVDTEFMVLEEMTNEKFAKLLADSKLVFETRAAQEAKAAEEKRLADEKAAANKKAAEEAAALEQERLRIENERLKREKEAAAQKAKEEEEQRELARQKEEQEREQERAAVQAELDRAAAEAALAKKREAEANKAALDALEAQKKASEEKIRLAQEEARKAQEELIAKANKERAEQQAALDKANAEKARLEQEQKAAVAAQQEQAAKAAEQQAKVDSASNSEKLRYLAEDIRALNIPSLTGPTGTAIRNEIITQIDLFAKWVEKKSTQA